MHFERFSTKLYLLFFLILTSFAISSCDLNGKDPLITMENLAKEAKKDATKWNEKQMKLKIQQASEMLKVLNNNKKDYS